MREARRRHTKEFKIEAIRLAEGSRKGPGAVAKELGITPELLRRWRRELQAAESEADAFPGVRGKTKRKESGGGAEKSSESSRKLTSQDEEIRRLRRENALLREEREILKKAAAFFARESR